MSRSFPYRGLIDDVDKPVQRALKHVLSTSSSQTVLLPVRLNDRNFELGTGSVDGRSEGPSRGRGPGRCPAALRDADADNISRRSFFEHAGVIAAAAVGAPGCEWDRVIAAAAPVAATSSSEQPGPMRSGVNARTQNR
jgi:hypothetical protein